LGIELKIHFSEDSIFTVEIRFSENNDQFS